jgi:hypothetical protein
MRDPVRDLPHVINSSMTIAFTSFTLMVTALYVALPMSTMRENDTPVVVCLFFITLFVNTYLLHPTVYRRLATVFTVILAS